MIKAKTRCGQTLADIAIQTKGAIEALIDLAMVNGVIVTETFSSGEIMVPDKVYNQTLQKYVLSKGVSPATDRDESGIRLRFFSAQFTSEFA